MATHKLGNASTLLKNGALKHVEIDDMSLVLARYDDQYYAFSSTCPHYGAPLHEGYLHDHTLICPWHHACFDIRTGIRQEPPALDSLSSYPVTIVDGQVIVDLEPVKQPHNTATAPTETFVIVGGGAAGEAAIEELLRLGFAGNLVVLSAAKNVPVDRPNLSKDYLAGDAEPEWMPLRDMSWYDDHDVDLRLETRVTQIDPKAHIIKTDNGNTLHYDKLLLAPGSQPRRPKDIPGINLDGIFTLRHQSDADQIIATLKENSSVVIIGASFIGMEAAAALGKRGAHLTIVELAQVPFESILGKDVGLFFQRLHEKNGVQFYLNSGVEQFHTSNGKVTDVELSDGTNLATDAVILGVGVSPATEFLSDSGITLNEADRSICVDQFLRTSEPDIYAAGDVARYPVSGGETQRIEHWRVAQQHGFIAARNMLGGDDHVAAHIPFFWTAQWGTHLRYVGFASDWDEIIFQGNPQDGDFIAFYLKDNRMLAAAGVNHDKEMGAVEMLLKHDLPLTADQIQNPDFDITALITTF